MNVVNLSLGAFFLLFLNEHFICVKIDVVAYATNCVQPQHIFDQSECVCVCARGRCANLTWKKEKVVLLQLNAPLRWAFNECLRVNESQHQIDHSLSPSFDVRRKRHERLQQTNGENLQTEVPVTKSSRNQVITIETRIVYVQLQMRMKAVEKKATRIDSRLYS